MEGSAVAAFLAFHVMCDFEYFSNFEFIHCFHHFYHSKLANIYIITNTDGMNHFFSDLSQYVSPIKKIYIILTPFPPSQRRFLKVFFESFNP